MPETQFFLMPSDQKDILAEVFDRDPRVQLFRCLGTRAPATVPRHTMLALTGRRW